MQPVVHFVSYDAPEDIGGVSSWLRKIVPRLRAHAIDARVDLFCFGNGGGVNAAWYRQNEVPVRLSPWRDDTREATKQCLRWLEEELPSVYIPNCILPAYFAAAEASRCGVRTIGVLHSDDPFYWGIVDEFVQGEDSWRLTELVVVSRFLHDAVKHTAQVPVHEIPYGVQVREQSSLRPTQRVRLIYTGRLVEEQKRISDVTRAICRVLREHPILEAWIVGGGSAEHAVEEIIRAEGLEERALLKGRVEPAQVLELLQESHIFVLLSDYEGLPVSLLEAMSIGVVPVCLKMRSGVSEVVRHLENGMLVGDRGESFAAAVSQLVKDPELWSKLSVAAKRTICERYSDEPSIDRWKQLLLASPSTVVTGGRLQTRLELPPPNPKFGHYDQRPHSLQRAWGRLSGRWSRMVRSRPFRP